MKEKSTVFVPKKYEKLTIRDHFMFGKICRNPRNSQLILEALLNKDVNIMNDPEIEKTVTEYYSGKHVRLDLLVKDEDKTVYNAELQNKSNNIERQEELPKRGRYYRAILDKANFYDDGSITLFFNATANLKDLPNKTKNMLEYIQNGTVNDVATKHLEAEVIAAREMEEWREEYMLTLVHDNDVYNDGYDSRQPEIDELNAEIAAKDAEIKRLKEQLEQTKKHSTNEKEPEGRSWWFIFNKMNHQLRPPGSFTYVSRYHCLHILFCIFFNNFIKANCIFVFFGRAINQLNTCSS